MSNTPTLVRFRATDTVPGSDSRKMMRVMAAEVALNKMFTDERFSICTVREACEALGAKLTPEAEAILHPLHCVNWDQIPAGLKAEIPHLIKESIQRSTVVRSMVQDMILGDFLEKEPQIEVVLEEAKKDSGELVPAEKTKPFYKWW